MTSWNVLCWKPTACVLCWLPGLSLLLQVCQPSVAANQQYVLDLGWTVLPHVAHQAVVQDQFQKRGGLCKEAMTCYPDDLIFEFPGHLLTAFKLSGILNC